VNARRHLAALKSAGNPILGSENFPSTLIARPLEAGVYEGVSRDYLQPHPKLLIVDDDPRMRELLLFAAQQSGAFPSVVVAGDGAEALNLLQKGEAPLPDVILTDLSMPQVDGFELVERLKQDPRLKEIPVVMCTSSDLPGDRERALALGCRAFYEKPLGVDALTEMIHAIGSMLKAA
jgi:CheY-like chemotaxis protein